MITRRSWLGRAALLGGAAAVGRPLRALAQAPDPHADHRPPATSAIPAPPSPPVAPRRVPPPPTAGEVARARAELGYPPVMTPDGVLRPLAPQRRLEGVPPDRRAGRAGVRARHDGEASGATTARLAGPTIEAVEGDRVRIFVTNRLPEHTSDPLARHPRCPTAWTASAACSSRTSSPARPTSTSSRLRQHGTYMYHPHADEMVQMALGMMGFFVIHPRTGRAAAGRSTATSASSRTCGAIEPGTAAPEPERDARLQHLHLQRPRLPGHRRRWSSRLGDRVRLRFANVCMNSHPIHIHGHRLLADRDRRRPDPAHRLVAGDDDQRPARHHARRRVRRRQPRRLAAPLPQDPPRDERDGPRRPQRDRRRPERSSRRSSPSSSPGYMAMGTTGMSEHAAHAGQMPARAEHAADDDRRRARSARSRWAACSR